MVVVFVIRPVAGFLALVGFEWSLAERAAIAVYGLREIGILYYLSYGLNQAAFEDPDAIWELAGLTIQLSIVSLDFSATPVVEESGRGEAGEAWKEDPEAHV